MFFEPWADVVVAESWLHPDIYPILFTVPTMCFLQTLSSESS